MRDKVIRANLIRTIQENRLFTAKDHVLVAVSGGYDSMHLLEWLTDQSLPKDLQPKVSAAYINHQLRHDAAVEEQYVAAAFERLDTRLMTTSIRRLTWEKVPKVGVEEQARNKRYAALIEIAEQVGATIIVTAHHRADQVETILYKLIRGSRLQQLMGMSMKKKLTSKISLVRPLLTLSKKELPALVKEPLIDWIEDYTNQDVTFARNQMRHDVLPALREINQQADQHILDLADQLAGLRQLVQPVLDEQTLALQAGHLNWQQADSALILILQEWLTHQGVLDIKDRQLRQVIKLMRNPNVAHGIVQLSNGYQLKRNKTELILLGNS